MSNVREYERYHGIVLTRIVSDAGRSIAIAHHSSNDKASYVLDGRLGLYIKYSSKRLSPWRFSFLKTHQEEIEILKNTYSEVCVSLVCGIDGVAVLSHQQLKEVLDEEFDSIESISVKRRRSGMYDVRGSNGKLRFKVAQSDCPRKILDCLATGAGRVP